MVFYGLTWYAMLYYAMRFEDNVPPFTKEFQLFSIFKE